MQSFLVPARDLVLSPGGRCAKRRGETLSGAFTRCDIAAGSTGAAYFVIQGAPVESDAAAYHWLLREVSAQVRRESPDTAVLATVNPGLQPVSSLAVTLRQGLCDVSGYEVNCTPATADLAVELMSLVSSFS